MVDHADVTCGGVATDTGTGTPRVARLTSHDCLSTPASTIGVNCTEVLFNYLEGNPDVVQVFRPKKKTK